jgi:hypothetical protein
VKGFFPSIDVEAMYPARIMADSNSQIITTGFQGTKMSMELPPRQST